MTKTSTAAASTAAATTVKDEKAIAADLDAEIARLTARVRDLEAVRVTMAPT